MVTPETNPLRVCSFESRRGSEMKSLIERRGGAATIAPSMQEVPLEENEAALRFARRLLDGEIDMVVFMTGVGAQALLDAALTEHDRREYLSALDRCWIAVRGPKPAAVLRKWNVHVDCRAPEPNTWRELLAGIEAAAPLSGKRLAVQEYGQPSEEFYEALRERGADVMPVPVYRWALPEETGPLAAAVRGTIDGRFDAVLFTSAFQLTSVLTVADESGSRDEWLVAANRGIVGSIGPSASAALREAGLPPDIEADPPKMGHLVRAVFEQGPEVLDRKRRSGD